MRSAEYRIHYHYCTFRPNWRESFGSSRLYAKETSVLFLTAHHVFEKKTCTEYEVFLSFRFTSHEKKF